MKVQKTNLRQLRPKLSSPKSLAAKLILIALAAIMLSVWLSPRLIPVANARPRPFTPSTMSNFEHTNQNIFHTDMYFGYSFDGEDDKIHIFSSSDQIKIYAQSLSDQIPGMSQYIDDFFAVYNDDFFSSYKLVIAIVERGSGMLRFELDSVDAGNNILQVNINRIVPPILTHDMRQWVMVLPVCNSLQFDTVNITATDVLLDKMP